ncbi:class I SAM-dependent methyltransferase [Sphaerisporangium fuscum]|uniref:class I SAM-dependent methyltransferase n=1 Tax=Sphaerisporangium fuscum TaxID=2835868 RepID=UPI001BDC4A91|nr:class I SAM-dependent methyltransferase [Sphaerisporangium fuscum]
MKIELPGLTPVQETLLLTLYCRALDSRAPRPVLGDTTADRLVGSIDYDFGRLKVNGGLVAQSALRAKKLDEVVRNFLVAHPDAVVLDLGAGLDTRILRAGPPATVGWYDVDFPNVAEIRRRLLPEPAAAHAVGAALTDPDWLKEIPTGRPAVIVADGLLPFLSRDDVIRLFNRLTGHFPSGELAFNAYGSFASRAMKYQPSIKALGLTASAGFDDAHEPERWDSRLRLAQDMLLVRSPEVSAFPPAVRALTRLFALSTTLARQAVRVLHYRF